jgi:hypothetical protein
MTFLSYVTFLLEQINALGFALGALAIVLFMIGIFRYSIGAGSDPDSKKNLRTFLLYGFIALIVIGSFWFILDFVLNSFEVGVFVP